jgi:hypothetical protein
MDLEEGISGAQARATTTQLAAGAPRRGAPQKRARARAHSAGAGADAEDVWEEEEEEEEEAAAMVMVRKRLRMTRVAVAEEVTRLDGVRRARVEVAGLRAAAAAGRDVHGGGGGGGAGPMQPVTLRHPGAVNNSYSAAGGLPCHPLVMLPPPTMIDRSGATRLEEAWWGCTSSIEFDPKLESA